MWLYDAAYLEEYKRRAQSDIGQRIYDERWRFVQEFAKEGTLLDYGCGAGAFHSNAPKKFTTYGYDINPFSGFNTLPNKQIDILTMWDVIEHLIDPTKPLLELSPKWIILSTPNIDASPDDVTQFKHWKPGEHLHYFNLKSITAVLACVGYKVVGHNFREGEIRDKTCPKAILSVAAKKSL